MVDLHHAIVLVIDADRHLAEVIGEHLSRHGIDADFAVDGTIALNLMASNRYDAVIVERALPRMDGLELCVRIRASAHARHVPILMLSVLDGVDDKVAGLAAGADDYLVKPCAPSELLARLHVLMRRARHEVSPDIRRVGNLVVDRATGTARLGRRHLDLTPLGYRILSILMRESPRVVSRRELEQELWGADVPASDSLRSHVYTLRKALDADGEGAMLRTRPTFGYSIEAPDNASRADDGTPSDT